MAGDPIQFLRNGLTVFTSALYQTTSTFVETPRAVFLIDPCWLPYEIEQIRNFVQSRIKQRKLYLIFTHSDYDHILGYRAFPDARVIASRKFATLPYKDVQVRKAIDFDQEHYITREYPIEYPDVDIEIDKDGKALHYSGNVATFYQAPGHTVDGMFIVFEPMGVLIAGDYLSDIEPPLIEHDLGAYRRTLAKVDRILRLHQIKYMVPGHGSVSTDTSEVLRRRDESIEYLDDLESAMNTQSIFPLDKYRSRYHYFGEFTKFHEHNKEFVRAIRS